jgi:hypothetical protein
MDRRNTFDDVLRTSNLCLKQIKFEVNLKEMYDFATTLSLKQTLDL